MKRLLACALLCLLTGSALAGGYSTGSAFRHVARVDLCGTPRTGVTWQANRATQTFSRCGVVRATYRTVLPASPSPTATSTARPTAAPRPTSTPWPTPIPTATLPASSDPVLYLLGLINASRQQAGLGPLSIDSAESACSLAHSAHMAAEGYISHDQFPADICTTGWTTAGENVGQAFTPTNTGLAQLHQEMMAEGAAGGHYQNLMSTTFTRIGIGVDVGTDGRVWLTQDFTN